MIIEIELDRLLIDDAFNPREHLNNKHVEEFVEMGGEWPLILARPIEDGWYTHQLIDGFHRAEAAERLELAIIKARSEEMTDEEAIARSIRENLHGLPLTVEARKMACVHLRETGWEQQRIAVETGISQTMVATYLAAYRVESVLVPGTKEPQLGVSHAKALERLMDTSEEVQAQLPVIAHAVTEHKLGKEVTAALADAAKKSPEHTSRIIERAVNEKLAPDAIRKAADVLADETAPEDLKEHILTSGTMIQDADGNVPASEIGRQQRMGEEQSRAALAYPFSAALVKLAECARVSDESIQAWLDTTPLTLRDTPELQLRMVADWLAHVRQLIEDNKRRAFRAVK